jgi:hypothetical protein
VFRNDIIRQYLVFILELHEEPSEIYAGPPGIDAKDLASWRDVFLSELQQRMARNTREEGVIREAFDSLDQGKMYVFHGQEWLEGQLFGDPSAR